MEEQEELVAAVADQLVAGADRGADGLCRAGKRGVAGEMAIGVVDALEMVQVEHGERELTVQIAQAVVEVAAVVDVGGRVDVDLPVAQKQLVEHARVLVAAQVLHADGADQLECVGRSVHLNAYGVDVEHLVAHGLDLCLGTAGADDLLRDAVLAALRLVPDGIAVLAFFHDRAV